ncbi:hypothetical protein EG028_02075 [Chitinophaga barathri]|uniref:Uncharacterized protein n=1 Tax=Chitinophaga barathri TaxID=1647451 RepID=A0A3N4N639_9BACT|nr:hypothetical protein EG028_02075 [Chitinophaga barathri]
MPYFSRVNQIIYLGLPKKGRQPPSLRTFFTRHATISQMADVFGTTEQVADFFLKVPSAIWAERLQMLDEYFGAEAGTFAAMTRVQVEIDRRKQRYARPVDELIPYRELLFNRSVTTVHALVRRGLKPTLIARVLGISAGRAHYILSHPGQLGAQQLVDLDTLFAVEPDTFADLAFHQTEHEHAKYQPAKTFYRQWCLRKRRRRH